MRDVGGVGTGFRSPFHAVTSDVDRSQSAEVEVPGFVPVDTVKARSGAWSPGVTLVPQEEPVTLTINGRELVTLLATPGDRSALVAGFLFDEGIIDRIEQIESLEEEEAGVRVRAEGVDLGLRLFQRRVLGSGCGRSFTFTSALDALAAAGRVLPVDLPWVGASVVRQSAQATYSGGELYRRTRGTHAAALFERTGVQVCLAEDIGRHNAVDKAVGGLLLAGRPLTDLFMVVTGRVSSEMVNKIAKTRIALLVTKSVPTGLALDYARKVGLCVVGRATGSRLFTYTFPEMLDPNA
jgi:FdhD protein